MSITGGNPFGGVSAALTTVSHTPVNYTASGATIEGNLVGIDAALGAQIVTDATTARTAAIGDANRVIYFTSNSAIGFTFATLAAGTVITYIQGGDGQITAVASGVTFLPTTHLKTLRKGSVITAIYLTTTLVALPGDTAA